MDVTDAEDGDIGHEAVVLPGTQRVYLLDEVNGEPMIPGEHFTINVAYVAAMGRQTRTVGGGGVDRVPAPVLYARRPNILQRVMCVCVACRAAQVAIPW